MQSGNVNARASANLSLSQPNISVAKVLFPFGAFDYPGNYMSCWDDSVVAHYRIAHDTIVSATVISQKRNLKLYMPVSI